MGEKTQRGAGYTFIDFDNMWSVVRRSIFDALSLQGVDRNTAERILDMFTPSMLLDRIRDVATAEGAPLQVRCYFDTFLSVNRRLFPRSVRRRLVERGIETIDCPKQISGRGRDRRTKDIVDPVLSDAVARLDEGTKQHVSFFFATHDTDFVFSTMRRVRDRGRRVSAILVRGANVQSIRDVAHFVHEIWFEDFMNLAVTMCDLYKRVQTPNDVKSIGCKEYPRTMQLFQRAVGVINTMVRESSEGAPIHVLADEFFWQHRNGTMSVSQEEAHTIVAALQFLQGLTLRKVGREELHYVLNRRHSIVQWALEKKGEGA